jgi:hypothetical protein
MNEMFEGESVCSVLNELSWVELEGKLILNSTNIVDTHNQIIINSIYS